MAEVCRKRGISEQTFYRWRRKLGEMSVPEASSAAGTGAGKQSAERMVAERDLEIETIKGLLRKVVTAQQRQAWTPRDAPFSERRGCALLEISRPGYHYQPQRRAIRPWPRRLGEIARERKQGQLSHRLGSAEAGRKSSTPNGCTGLAPGKASQPRRRKRRRRGRRVQPLAGRVSGPRLDLRLAEDATAEGPQTAGVDAGG
ncbi:transposase [bacterium]|nr:transposase [bacterium]